MFTVQRVAVRRVSALARTARLGARLSTNSYGLEDAAASHAMGRDEIVRREVSHFTRTGTDCELNGMHVGTFAASSSQHKRSPELS